MSLIEHLMDDSWEPALRRTFEVVLEVLDSNPFLHVGSAADDLRAMLRGGGVAWARRSLRRELTESRLSETHRNIVMDGFEALVTLHRDRLDALERSGIIPGDLAPRPILLACEARGFIPANERKNSHGNIRSCWSDNIAGNSRAGSPCP